MVFAEMRMKLILNTFRPFIFPGNTVLDIGCGNGILSKKFEEHFNCSVVGTDIISYLKTEIPFKKMESIDKLDFNNKQFDVALFNDVLHHIPFESQFKLIHEALRVSNRVIIFEVKPTPTSLLLDFICNKLDNPKISVTLTHRKKHQWERIFRENEIKFETVHVKRPFIYSHTNYLFLLHK